MRNPLCSVQKLIEQINATFLFVKKKKRQQQQKTKTSKMTGMSLNVEHRHVREKKLTKKYNKEI